MTERRWIVDKTAITEQQNYWTAKNRKAKTTELHKLLNNEIEQTKN